MYHPSPVLTPDCSFPGTVLCLSRGKESVKDSVGPVSVLFETRMRRTRGACRQDHHPDPDLTLASPPRGGRVSVPGDDEDSGQNSRHYFCILMTGE